MIEKINNIINIYGTDLIQNHLQNKINEYETSLKNLISQKENNSPLINDINKKDDIKSFYDKFVEEIKKDFDEILFSSKNQFLSNNQNEIQGNKDLNLSIKNNPYIQNYPLNNNNNDVSKLININNYPFEYQNNNNIYIPAINYYKNQKGWMVIDTLNGNLVETPFTSFGLYQYLSSNSKNLKSYKIIDYKFNIKLSGEIIFNILSQYFESDIKNNQIQKMIQNINLSEIPDFKANDINMKMNLNQFNINNIDSGFNLNSLNKINNNEYKYNNMQSKLLNNNINNNNSINQNEINNISDFFNNNNNSFNYNQKNQSPFNSNSNSNFFNNNNNNNYNPNFDFKINQDNNNNKLNNNNNINIENQNQSLENELFLAENYFNKELTNKNNNQNISEQDQDILDDKNDNEEYNNINNLILSSTKNINSNSKSNIDINDDINNNEPNQFDSNNDYQYDNYNAIFSQYSNENNNEGNL